MSRRWRLAPATTTMLCFPAISLDDIDWIALRRRAFSLKGWRRMIFASKIRLDYLT